MRILRAIFLFPGVLRSRVELGLEFGEQHEDDAAEGETDGQA